MFRVKSVIMDQNAVFRALRRISYEIIEKIAVATGFALSAFAAAVFRWRV